MKDIIWIIGILAVTIAIGIWYLYNFQEGFQVNLPSTDLIKRQFWDIVSKKDTPNVAENIQKVRDPAPNDTMPVKFPIYMSVYALAKYNNDPIAARKALFDDYQLLQQELTTDVYDHTDVNDWKEYPKELTCRKLDSTINEIIEFINNTKKSFVDISGTIHKGAAIHDENMGFQNILLKECKKNPMSDACIRLASQDNPIYPLLQRYNNVTNALYNSEYDISENLNILHTSYKTLKCFNREPNLVFNVDDNMEIIDTPMLNEKLEQISPYYISPETLQFITSSIVSPSDIEKTTNTTSDMYIKIGNSVNGIKTLTS